jgi:hypothetical protein
MVRAVGLAGAAFVPILEVAPSFGTHRIPLRIGVLALQIERLRLSKDGYRKEWMNTEHRGTIAQR